MVRTNLSILFRSLQIYCICFIPIFFFQNKPLDKYYLSDQNILQCLKTSDCYRIYNVRLKNASPYVVRACSIGPVDYYFCQKFDPWSVCYLLHAKERALSHTLKQRMPSIISTKNVRQRSQWCSSAKTHHPNHDLLLLAFFHVPDL